MKSRVIRPTFLYALIAPVFRLLWVLPVLFIIIMSPPEFDILTVPLIGVVFLAYAYKVLLIRSRKYIISKEQVIYKRGIFSIATDYLELYRVKDYKEYRPFFMRLISTMKVTLFTSDRSKRYLKMEGIPNSPVVAKLRELVELNRGLKRVYEVD